MINFNNIFNNVQNDDEHLRAVKWSVLKREKVLPHLSRKLYHLTMGLICFCLYAFIFTKSQALIVLLIVGGSVVIFDFIRLRNKNLNNFTLSFFGSLMRREELKNITGHSFYVLGLLILVIFFPKQIALLSLLYLAVGDPAASIFGTLFGRHKIFGSKSLEGALANFVFSFMVTFVVSITIFKMPLFTAPFFALAGSIISVISELLPLPINDNFTIPVISALLLSVLFLIFPTYSI